MTTKILIATAAASVALIGVGIASAWKALTYTR
jgi:hypothetical protein